VWSPQGLVAMHYPEMWGFVEFSPRDVASAPSQTVPGSPDEGVLEPTAEDVARWLLRLVYYKERRWFAEHGTYTADLSLLGLTRAPFLAATPPGVASLLPWPPAIAATPRGFEASLAVPGGSKLVITADGAVR
jgi:hypothetical protein